MLALDAEVVLKSTKGERVEPVSTFFAGILQTTIEPDELLTEIRFKTPTGKKSSYKKLPNKASHYSVVGAAAVVGVADGKITDAAVAFSGLAEIPLRFDELEKKLAGAATDEASIEQACKGCAANVDALEDLHGSQDYRRAMAEVFAKRAILSALGK
jgi:carbon-monoxide dehydrogenase medium subunit